MNNHKVVFLNVGWMDNYQGLNGDPIKGGGSFPKTRRYGHEIFNFQPHNGRYYGYGRPASDSINLERLGSREGAPSGQRSGSVGGRLQGGGLVQTRTAFS